MQPKTRPTDCAVVSRVREAAGDTVTISCVVSFDNLLDRRTMFDVDNFKNVWVTETRRGDGET